ncbi:MAG: hypothetical protein MJY98_07680 [Fibrobacter sp.]|nr:hypothetical protein [Fibrobacter sp.]
MKYLQKKNFVFSAALVAALGFAGCNLFNPTEDVNIASDDAAALTYEGYLHYQKSEYTVAREYFEKAIKADSAYSEAWYGRAKTVLSMQPGLNIFELLSYAKSDGSMNAMSKFATMSDEQAWLLSRGIDSVLYYIDPFIKMEQQGKLDGKVKFANFSSSYTIMKMAKSGLLLRGSSLDIKNLLVFEGGNISVNFNGILEMGENMTDVLDATEGMIEGLRENPDQAFNVLSSVYPDVMENFTPTAVANALEATYNGIKYTNDNLKDAGVDRATVFSTNIGFDDDADGCIDEEVLDGFDNDGDGEVDEDLRDDGTLVKFNETALIEYYKDEDSTGMSYFIYYTGHPLDIIASVQPTMETAYVDVDGDGELYAMDEKEYTFFYPEHRDRRYTGDHRFQFAIDLRWEPAPEGEKIFYYKEKLRKDPLNPDYNLAWRKKHIGGCWNNYQSEMDNSYQVWMETHRQKLEGGEL